MDRGADHYIRNALLEAMKIVHKPAVHRADYLTSPFPGLESLALLHDVEAYICVHPPKLDPPKHAAATKPTFQSSTAPELLQRFWHVFRGRQPTVGGGGSVERRTCPEVQPPVMLGPRRGNGHQCERVSCQTSVISSSISSPSISPSASPSSSSSSSEVTSSSCIWETHFGHEQTNR
ncbi:hypothetical protein EYF80_016695 [Liparis tanakae]|uniref:Uncharacterized protein n=1 Tax=Liparis tanakae TaxID=230148 RepID=A0A4Z2I6D6_9TELE|nr:hypothetical protein EYF80_016695 [Liparis tanakae]